MVEYRRKPQRADPEPIGSTRTSLRPVYCVCREQSHKLHAGKDCGNLVFKDDLCGDCWNEINGPVSDDE